MSPIRFVACSDHPRDGAAIDGGVHSIPTVVVPEHRAVVDEAARAAS